MINGIRFQQVNYLSLGEIRSQDLGRGVTLFSREIHLGNEKGETFSILLTSTNPVNLRPFGNIVVRKD